MFGGAFLEGWSNLGGRCWKVFISESGQSLGYGMITWVGRSMMVTGVWQPVLRHRESWLFAWLLRLLWDGHLGLLLLWDGHLVYRMV